MWFRAINILTMTPGANGGPTMAPFPADEAELHAAGYERCKAAAATCRACKAQIEWWLTPNHRYIPLDVRTLVPHWATCPEARRSRTPPLTKPGTP
jgi:hypothetical protein